MADSIAEKRAGRALGVVRAVFELFESNPIEVIDRNGEAVGGFWQAREVGLALPNGKRVRVNAFKFLNEDTISITVADFNLLPGEPTYNSRPSYRVDIIVGKAAEKYSGSIGFATGHASVDWHGNVISDNWAETENDPEEIISILKSGKSFRP